MTNRRDPNKRFVAFWANEELKSALVEQAKVEGKSVSELIVEALEDLMDRKNKEDDNDNDAD